MMEDIKVKDKFPKIMEPLLQIQKASTNRASQYIFDFGDFVKECMDVYLEEENIKYIKDQIDDTLNLLNNSDLPKESLYSFYQIKLIEILYNEILNNIDCIKSENKGHKINLDQFLRLESLKPIFY